MAPNEPARKNHAELFPGHVSTLAVQKQIVGGDYVEKLYAGAPADASNLARSTGTALPPTAL